MLQFLANPDFASSSGRSRCVVVCLLACSSRARRREAHAALPTPQGDVSRGWHRFVRRDISRLIRLRSGESARLADLSPYGDQQVTGRRKPAHSFDQGESGSFPGWLAGTSVIARRAKVPSSATRQPAHDVAVKRSMTRSNSLPRTVILTCLLDFPDFTIPSVSSTSPRATRSLT